MDRSILVHMNTSSHEDLFGGTLRSRVLRGKEVFSFEASEDWIGRSLFRFLDPDLGQFSGPQYLRDDKPNFGLFLDSSPDRWGRLLMRRREALQAKQEGRKARPLSETDYLLGVFDGNRMGALRFKEDLGGAFLDDRAELAAPPFARLRQLEQASLHLEAEDAQENDDYAKWLAMLVAPGSSLGGARPKANVVDSSGDLWIAKFPSATDAVDQGAWEAVAATLAFRCGLVVPESRAEQFGRKGHTFLSRRFDRNAGARIHFASAMTLLGMRDGADSADGNSYLDLAEIIIRHGFTVEADLRQLWRRIAFGVAISNTDDHLRNHGFVLGAQGWSLSPAYDLNPNPDGTGLTLNISESDNALDFELVMDVSRHFRVPSKEAKQILADMGRIVRNWNEVARSLGIARREQEAMASAFRFPD
jgi:serine/threonine-protein kinase HipA